MTTLSQTAFAIGITLWKQVYAKIPYLLLKLIKRGIPHFYGLVYKKVIKKIGWREYLYPVLFHFYLPKYFNNYERYQSNGGTQTNSEATAKN